ncbi:M20/M25/M40 family metallo-hydrolase [Nitrosophilus alvini]|uniref:M20/M25/M40 family metallo-hydrolase n=1 Tax=Nitrosophilus alvini TaxID=2714855 RepID=UPI00190E2AFC|nr:M20/M25/M40 family metallo-hydrolase [Nitrosophilus alvini]
MRVLEIFYEICKIPHCSHKSSELKEYISRFSKKHGFETICDKSGNILCRKDSAVLCLQSHYDMVCVGEAPDIEIVKKDGYITAKNSSLGADNGIGVAIMLWLMEKGIKAEYLFTADEEVGMIGAQNLQFELKSKYMLNLDSEDEKDIFIGCAGGLDIKALCDIKLAKPKFQNFYEIEICNLPGGHSGVDIDKNIPNAIKELSLFLYENDFELVSFEGGERINSIPSRAKAVINAKTPPASRDDITVRKCGDFDFIIEDGERLIHALAAFPSGVRAYDKEFMIPLDSVNLSIVKTDSKKGVVEVSARSMQKKGLERLKIQTKAFFEMAGFKVESYGYYPPWEPKISKFAKKVKKIYEKEGIKAGFKAIHAGLECAVISQKYPDLEIVSIGPDILYPHSTREKVSIDSIMKIAEITEKLANDFS